MRLRKEGSNQVSQPEIKLNAVQCSRCGYVLISFHRHDFKVHSCQKGMYIMVDGGNEYIRRSLPTTPGSEYIDRTIYWPADES